MASATSRGWRRSSGGLFGFKLLPLGQRPDDCGHEDGNGTEVSDPAMCMSTASTSEPFSALAMPHSGATSLSSSTSTPLSSISQKRGHHHSHGVQGGITGSLASITKAFAPLSRLTALASSVGVSDLFGGSSSAADGGAPVVFAGDREGRRGKDDGRGVSSPQSEGSGGMSPESLCDPIEGGSAFLSAFFIAIILPGAYIQWVATDVLDYLETPPGQQQPTGVIPSIFSKQGLQQWAGIPKAFVSSSIVFCQMLRREASNYFFSIPLVHRVSTATKDSYEEWFAVAKGHNLAIYLFVSGALSVTAILGSAVCGLVDSLELLGMAPVGSEYNMRLAMSSVLEFVVIPMPMWLEELKQAAKDKTPLPRPLDRLPEAMQWRLRTWAMRC